MNRKDIDKLVELNNKLINKVLDIITLYEIEMYNKTTDYPNPENNYIIRNMIKEMKYQNPFDMEHIFLMQDSNDEGNMSVQENHIQVTGLNPSDEYGNEEFVFYIPLEILELKNEDEILTKVKIEVEKKFNLIEKQYKEKLKEEEKAKNKKLKEDKEFEYRLFLRLAEKFKNYPN